MHTQLLDEFLVLVELLQSLDVHEGQVVGLGLVAMQLVAQDAHLHRRTRHVAQPVLQAKLP